jgi:hypothetical protein
MAKKISAINAKRAETQARPDCQCQAARELHRGPHRTQSPAKCVKLDEFQD